MPATTSILIDKILTTAAKRKASNIHLTAGACPTLRIDGDLVELKDEPVVTNSSVEDLANLWLDDKQKKILKKEKEIIISREIGKKFRLKINFFQQKGFLSATLGFISANVPPLLNLGLPKSVYSLADRQSGLIVITGPFGSGRTTTMASLIEEINKNRSENIITIEKPIEYIFSNKKSLIEQREVGCDVNSFVDGLEYVQQADVDVVAVGVNFEEEVIPLILDFANSGRLAIMGMDTTSSIRAIEDIISSFETAEKEKAQLLLSESLLAVIVQRLLSRVGSGLSLATEVLIATNPVKALIREGRIKHINGVLQSSRVDGMLSMDQSLAGLVKSGDVLIDQAVEYSHDPENFRAMIKN